MACLPYLLTRCFGSVRAAWTGLKFVEASNDIDIFWPIQLEMGDGQHLTDEFVQGMIDEMAPYKQA